jgi:hypothetical protein
MTGLLIGGSVAFAIVVLALLVAIEVTGDQRESRRKVRRRDLAHASQTINAIDNIVNKYYSTSDLTGQVMCDEIRATIQNHRKVIDSK